MHNALTEFVRLDLEELRKRFEVTEYFADSRFLNPRAVWQKVKDHDLVFGWFASWHTFLPFRFAKMLGKPSVLVVGGYDVANMPEIGYGHQRGGLKKLVSRSAVRSATRVITTSNYSRDELKRNMGLTNGFASTIYLGAPDRFGSLLNGQRERLALTVGNVDRANLRRKGLEPFVRAAALLPDVKFALVGGWKDEAIDHLRSIATPNVIFAGRVTDEELLDYYRRASVYVQPSLHEGFGLSVAEAMLAGCIPVTTSAGSLPEVTGGCGVRIASVKPASVAEAIEKALTFSETMRVASRSRILEDFPLTSRGVQIEQLIRPLVSRR